MENKNQIQKINKENNQVFLAVNSKLKLLVKGQESNSNKLKDIGNDLRKGFIGLALRNKKLLKLNDQLKQQLDEVLNELNIIKQKLEEKAVRKEAWTNRKRLLKRDPMTAGIYTELMRVTKRPTFIDLRTRMALCILAMTKIRINELLPLKVSHLKTLFKENWIAINRSKHKPSNHKAFLIKEGKKIMHYPQKKFELIFLMKEPDSYLFIAESKTTI